MAEITNTTMFTNGGASSATPDLLQRAFQEVVDAEDHENEIVAFFHSDENGTHTIQLTPAEAAALGLTFEVDPVEEVPGEVAVKTDEGGSIDELRENLGGHGVSEVPNIVKMERARYQAHFESDECGDIPMRTDALMKEEAQVHEEHMQEKANKSSPRQNLSLQREPTISGESQESITTIANNVKSLKPEERRFVNCSENTPRYSYEGTKIQTQQLSAVHNSQTQILQRLPVILPSSQFVIKPAQTVLKPTRNVRILPNTNKMTNGTASTINAVHTINGNGQNSILLPKATLLNALSSQIIKATPLTTQLLNANNIPAQLLNVSQILSGSSEIASHVINTSQICTPVVNVTSVPSQNILTSQIRLSPPVLKTVQTTAQRNPQHFLTPIIKNTPISSPIVKNTSTLSNINSKTPILKPLKFPSQILRTISTTAASSTIAKNSVTNTAVFRNSSSIAKSAIQDLRPTQMVSTPVSILKPQSRTTVNSQNIVGALANAPQNSSTVQSSVSNQFGDIETIKPLQNGTRTIKVRQNGVAAATALAARKPKTGTIQKPIAAATEKTDTTKPLGSSENPIQIVQQGHTFHSMQRLNQSQLKQIAHVLQQRSQKSAMPNEKIVYRVVFPEELDLRIRNPVNLLRGRGGKRGRPKKNAMKPTVVSPKPTVLPEEEHEDSKDERKKVMARTRSGRLSRPPRHMLRDYKQLRNLESMEPDPDDSDGGYSDYITNGDKLEDEESPKELLTGLELPKRKISDHFKCPTCHKIYLGRTRMARHFEMHPHHGSPEQLPPPTPEPELKQAPIQDPLKRKGKKRGPWAYVTPEAKSERRQAKLKEAISVCDNTEITNIAAQPVLNALSLYELLVLKSENKVRNFLDELKKLMDKIREKAGIILTMACDDVCLGNNDVIDLSEELLCDALGLNPGLYRINNSVFEKIQEDANTAPAGEPALKRQRLDITKDGKENLDEHMSSGFSENSDLSVSEFLSEKKTDSAINPSCPEVLTALTLMPRNPIPVNNADSNRVDSISKLLISNPEIQNQLSESPGFIKLEPLEQGFVKLESDSVDPRTFPKVQNGFDRVDAVESQTYTKGFQRLEPPHNHKIEITNSVSKIVPITTTSDLSCMRTAECTESDLSKMLPMTSIAKISESLPIISTTCDSSIFGSTENLDMSKISNYDQITHLDILNTSSVVDKNLMIDEKLVEQLHLVDQSDLVDELVSERLKNIPDFSIQITNGPPMPDNILENNLISNNSNLDPDLDFEALSEEFNRNTRS